MILFLLKGLVRDRSRSLFPVLIVVAGVMLTVVLYSFIMGTEADIVRANASFQTGHLMVTTRGYGAAGELRPLDLALGGVDSIRSDLSLRYPGVEWTPRIRFAGLLDLPDSLGETKSQGPVVGLAVELGEEGSLERSNLNLDRALQRGRLPSGQGEAVLSETFCSALGLDLGQTATLITTSMYGSLVTANFRIVGTIRFGVSAMDRGAMLVDCRDLRAVLDMPDAAGELLGFFRDGAYDARAAEAIRDNFNSGLDGGTGVLDPEMTALRDHGGLAQTLDLARAISAALVGLFVLVMSIVLWNAGLMGSLRRYGEIGVRLAIGEDKGHIYRTLLAEALLVGLAGAVVGTILGLIVSHHLQSHGLNIAPFLRNASMLITDVLRARVTPASSVIGFVPGLLATFLGAAVSGLGIYKRQTSQLAKELEA